MKQINTILTQEQINLLKNKKGGTFSSTFVTNKNNKKRLVTKRQRVARKVQRNTDHTWTK